MDARAVAWASKPQGMGIHMAIVRGVRKKNDHAKKTNMFEALDEGAAAEDMRWRARDRNITCSDSNGLPFHLNSPMS
jgi:hypothetical protein